MEVPLFGWADHDPADPYWDDLMENVLEISREDQDVLSSIQTSLNTGKFSGSMLSYLERALYWFNEEIDRSIGSDNIPQEMRMSLVLVGQVETE